FVQGNGPETEQFRASVRHPDEERLFQKSLALLENRERGAIGVQPPGQQDDFPVCALDQNPSPRTESLWVERIQRLAQSANLANTIGHAITCVAYESLFPNCFGIRLN